MIYYMLLVFKKNGYFPSDVLINRNFCVILQPEKIIPPLWHKISSRV